MTKEGTARRFVHDQAELPAHSDGAEVLVLRLLQFVKAEAGIFGIELEIEGGGFDSFLFIASKPRQAVGEGVGDEEGHMELFDAADEKQSSSTLCADRRTVTVAFMSIRPFASTARNS